ncbi:hypothetical protein [Burkholderia ubonensis]|uniref:hypothetical protein n=1 Tax=Burkholderia ubonensis TaxID=101571 RepID=UPI000B2A2744|nr:hypothetical protein [Burkholderia ubonensis]
MLAPAAALRGFSLGAADFDSNSKICDSPCPQLDLTFPEDLTGDWIGGRRRRAARPFSGGREVAMCDAATAASLGE